jgi:uncharacterized membrane protein YkoI
MWKILPLVLLAAMLFASAHAPRAAAGPRPMGWQLLAAADTLVPLDRVYRDLGKRYGGKALDATTLRPGPGVVLYEVQFLTHDGRKLVITVNAHDGAVVATRGAH